MFAGETGLRPAHGRPVLGVGESGPARTRDCGVATGCSADLGVGVGPILANSAARP